NRLARNSSNDFRFSSLQYCPARSASFCRSHARISSILVRTNRARLRLSWGGIGGYLVNKFVKQTKIHPWLAHQSGLHQVGFVETEPEEGAGCARVLGKADAAMRQEQTRL